VQYVCLVHIISAFLHVKSCGLLAFMKRICCEKSKIHTQGEATPQSLVTIRSPFCGYNTISCIELNSEDLLCYSNETESFS